jgi:hypothetical protein
MLPERVSHYCVNGHECVLKWLWKHMKNIFMQVCILMFTFVYFGEYALERLRIAHFLTKGHVNLGCLTLSFFAGYPTRGGGGEEGGWHKHAIK